jgi:hypothetical protein
MGQSTEDDSADVAEDGLYSVADTVNARADESEFKNRDAIKALQNAASSTPPRDEDGGSNQDNSAKSGDSFKDNPTYQ